ncbi:MAG: hypothetical protein HY925_11025 [Elusimicrobia bacterium]|nr:hypothetical protein [Elusimicrobiota bacterium]
MIIQSNKELVPGRNIYVGVQEIPVTVGALASRSQDLFYYTASVAGRPRLGSGDKVSISPSRRLTIPQSIAAPFRQSYTFAEKFRAEITTVQGDRAMIDKGTLHEVHERDLYRVSDASGTYKGLLEVRGIGDLQSSGRIYNRFEDIHRRVSEIRPGDQVEFIGQRRLLGLGFLAGSTFSRKQILHSFDKSSAAGLLWNITSSDGWGLEMLFGVFTREGKDSTPLDPTFIGGNQRLIGIDERAARYVAPIWLKKNLFYPSMISPFLAGGLCFFDGYHSFETLRIGVSEGRDKKEKKTIAPVLGAGIEFFPARFFRPRVEVRHFIGPTITARGNEFNSSATFYSFAILSAW